LDQITSGHLEFDAVIIIRGGGSKVDLSGFDNYNLAQKIANYPIPVFTGIGHDIDISSLDLVAHKYFKTPTAVAEYFIETNSSFLGEVHEQVKKVLNIAQNAFTHINYDLKSILNNLRNASKDKITEFKYNLDKIKGEIYKSAQITINHSQFSIESIKQKINLQNPLEILKKGYVIVVQNNKKIKTVKDFDISKPADLNFADGVIKVKH
jgi:exodeoxyribonuclease VII large subunit